MRLRNLVFDDKVKAVSFRFNSKWYKCDLQSYSCIELDKSLDTLVDVQSLRSRPRWQRDGRFDSLSPDKKWISSIQNYNVVIKAADNSEVIPFTTDGTEAKPYVRVTWSPDSKYAVGYKSDPREHKEVYHILTSLSNTFRGALRSQRYAQPGDEFTSYEMFVFPFGLQKTAEGKYGDL